MRLVYNMDRVWFKKSSSDTKIPIEGHAPRMAYYCNRISTFDKWPVQLKQNKHSLAAAGFYYTNNSDIVKCFSCGLSLGNWLKEDNVWKEHQRWSPRCHYINMVGVYRESDMVLGTAV